MADDIECNESHDRLGMEAIRSLHQQLDDDENGNIDLSESDDVRNFYSTFFWKSIFEYQKARVMQIFSNIC